MSFINKYMPRQWVEEPSPPSTRVMPYKPFESARHPVAVGAVAGVLETTALYWTVTWGIRRNANLPLLNADLSTYRNFTNLYRGYSLQLFGMVPLFAVMTTANITLRKLFTPPHKKEPAPAANAVIALVSGMVSTVVNPVEVIQVQRAVLQNAANAQGIVKAVDTRTVAAHILKTTGWKGFASGAGVGAFRNGIYSLGINAVAKPVAAKVVKALPADSSSGVKRGVTIGTVVFIGMGVGFSSQPFHTIATLLRTDLNKRRFVNARDAARQVYRGKIYPGKTGVRAFMTGSLPRNVRIVLGAVLMHEYFSRVNNK